MPEVVIGKDIDTGEIITIGDLERAGGFYILGEPRTGKSHLMISMALQDMKHGHPVLFIDPHFEAIKYIIAHLPLSRQQDVILLDPTDKDYAFSLNPLQCEDPSDPMALDRVYGRVEDIFIKLWGNEQGQLGIWVEKILRNAVYLLLENPGYTLVDIPLLLSKDTSFRDALLKNVTVNPYVKNFWREEFDGLSPIDRRREVEPLLSRLDRFMANTTIRHFLGQSQSTIDLHTILNTSPTPHIVLLRMPVTLADTVKSVIGTLLISEMLAAAFDRDQLPEAERRPFPVYCDEFQMFATQDFAKLFTQTGKFKLMPAVAHQVREGQLKPDDPNTGATLAAPLKAFFSLSITDSGKVAPLMAKRVEATEKRREAQLVISPSPVEDIWERGHPPPEVMKIRGQYFWVVQHLRNNPNEKSFVFDPFQVSPEYRRENPVTFQMTDFDDWEYYRSSAEMLRRGISLLNQYYYDWMQQRYDLGKVLSDAQLELIIQVIACWGGVLGFLPMLRPVLPDEKRSRLTYMMTEKRRQQFEQDKRDKIQATRDEIQYLRDHKTSFFIRDNLTTKERERECEVSRISREILEKKSRTEEAHNKDLWNKLRALEQSSPPAAPYIPQTISSPRDISNIQWMAIQAGMTGSEVEQLIEWEVRPLTSTEKAALADLVTILVNRDIDRAKYENNGDRISQHYAAAMSQRLSPAGLASEKAAQRLRWQRAELRLFIDACFRVAPRVLTKEPFKVPSGKYDESLTVERLQNDLIAEMGLELSRLNPRTAYVHVLQAKGGVQVVRQAKIQTLPLDPPHGSDIEEAIKEHSHEVAYKPRTEIEAEILERQEQWRRGPDNKPPPTRTGGDKPALSETSQPTETMTDPPPTQYTPEKASEREPAQQPESVTNDLIDEDFLKEAINTWWKKLTEADVLRIAVRKDELIKMLQWKYGYPWLSAEGEVHHRFRQYQEMQRSEGKAVLADLPQTTPDEFLSTPAIELISLKFFECEEISPPDAKHRYSTCFLKNTTRHVIAESRLRNLLYKKQHQRFKWEARFYCPNGSLLKKNHRYDRVTSDYEVWGYYEHYGWDEPGHWVPGTYRVEILFNDVKFAEGTFTIE